MRDRRRAAVALLLLVPALAAGRAGAQGAGAAEPDVAARVAGLTRQTAWTAAGAIKLRFRTFHPQGMLRVGADIFVSSVEVRAPPRPLTVPQGGHGRDAGSGVGRLFKVGPDGALRGQVTLGEGDVYHPGGIDFDGRWLWVPVSEYRPDSRAIVYRVDPVTMRAEAVFRFDDHLGALAFDPATRTLHGVSWGSRRTYSWRVGRDGRVGPAAAAAARPRDNPAHYIDYQDCHGLGAARMLCSGLAAYPSAPDGPPFELGGLELIDLRRDRPLWQVPVLLWSPGGRPMTQNAAFVEATARGLRAYFLPDDDVSTLFLFDAAVDGGARVRPRPHARGRARPAPPRSLARSPAR